ncbi:hypothetical protein EZL74_06600 [Flavobacterium silvisoli]|uniref:Carboxypeptidase-like regulatory domain-containing protein n=1 Tax=Flavobacterium silvisoli TaxID=2529433 RepID=A0A4V2L579_9FLAO|nr:hypothetical protein [Flavobacterium silvisoli]TBX69543.1 hypothetical protein EZL74_06600 [Flavobacterium silvisoli]
MKRFLLIIIVFSAVKSTAQEPLVLLRGKIVSQIKELGEINVVNLRSESVTTTSDNGNFTMFVKERDTLQFTGLQILTKKVAVTSSDINKQLFVVTVEPKVIPLEEVEIRQYPNINAVSLGILQKPAKTYTPAERKLRAAEEFHWYSPLLIPLGGMSVDGLINSITGRTAMLKKELRIERKEYLLQKIEYLFKPEFFTESLKIPKDYVRGFWYYAVEDPKLVRALQEKNKMMARFIFSDLATRYKELLNQN